MKLRINNNSLLYIYFCVILVMAYKGGSYLGVISIGMTFLSLLGFKSYSKLNTGDTIIRWHALFVVYIILISFVSIFAGHLNDTHYFVSYAVNMFLLCGTASYLLASQRNLEHFYLLLRNSSWLLLLFGIIEYFTKYNYTHRWLIEGYTVQLQLYNRISSIFTHPIAYGVYLGILLLILVYKPYRLRSFNIVYFCLLITNILMTQARSTFISLGIVIVLLFISKLLDKKNKYGLGDKKKKLKGTDFLMVCLIIIVGCCIIYINRNTIADFAGNIVERLMRGVTGYDQSIRLTVISNFISFFKGSNTSTILFGNGCGYSSQFMKIYAFNTGVSVWNETTDNMYISLLIDYGIFGICLFLIPTIKAFFIVFSIRGTFDLSKLNASIVVFLAIGLFIYEGLYWPMPFFFYVVTSTNMGSLQNRISDKSK